MEWWMVGPVLLMLVFGVAFRRMAQGAGNTYAGDLRRALAERDLQLVSVRVPGFMETLTHSPYPKIEVEFGASTEVNGVRGEFSHDRVCEVSGPNGVVEVWARLHFKAFRLVEVEFRPDPQEPGSEAVRYPVGTPSTEVGGR